MTDFDFDVLEADMHDMGVGFSLRDRAASAWADEKAVIERGFLIQATNRLENVLGVSNGENVAVTVVNLAGKGLVEVTVDGMRFKVEFHPGSDDQPESPPLLFVKLKSTTSTTVWSVVSSLAELGEKIAANAVIPEDS